MNDASHACAGDDKKARVWKNFAKVGKLHKTSQDTFQTWLGWCCLVCFPTMRRPARLRHFSWTGQQLGLRQSALALLSSPPGVEGAPMKRAWAGPWQQVTTTNGKGMTEGQHVKNEITRYCTALWIGGVVKRVFIHCQICRALHWLSAVSLGVGFFYVPSSNVM